MRTIRFLAIFMTALLSLSLGIKNMRANSASIVFSDGAETGVLTEKWSKLYSFGDLGSEYGTGQVHSGSRALAIDGVAAVTLDNLSDKTFEVWMYDDMSTRTSRSGGEFIANYMEIGEFGSGYNLYFGVTDYGSFPMKYALWRNGDPGGYLFSVDRTLGWHKFAVYLDQTGTGYQAYIDGEKIWEGQLVLGFNGKTGFYLGAYSANQDSVQTYFDDVAVTSGNTYEATIGGCSWTRLADMPNVRLASSSGIGIVDGKIIVVGGHEGSPGSGTLNEEYDPMTDMWASKTPYPRGDGRIGLNRNAVVGNEIYFFGGANVWNNYHTQTVDKYNPLTDTWGLDLATYPVRVENLGTVAYGNQIYCFGGNDYAGPSYNLGYRFDPASSTFTRLKDMPIGSVGSYPVVRDRRIWIVGGIDYPNPYLLHKTIQIYDPASDDWSNGPDLPEWNTYLYWAGVLADGALYLVYGDPYASSNPYIYRLIDSDGAWEKLCSAPSSNLYGYGVAGIDMQIHLFGGGDPKISLHQAALITPANVAPDVGSITAPLDPISVNRAVSVRADFTDANPSDSHSAVWDWGDGTTSAGDIAESNGSGTVAGSHAYSTPGVYRIGLTVTDNHGASGLVSSTTVKIVRMITALGPARVWIGLRNSDDVGTRFDLRAEAFRNGAPVGSGELRNVPGGSSGFNNAGVYAIPLTLAAQVAINPTDRISVRVSVRVAAESSHRSGTARLWFNDSAANSRFSVTISGVESTDYLLSGSRLSPNPGLGPKATSDVTVDRAKDGNAYKPFGTWVQAP